MPSHWGHTTSEANDARFHLLTLYDRNRCLEGCNSESLTREFLANMRGDLRDSVNV